jgi:hypothetical protein
MKPKKKGPGSAKQRGLSKLTISNYNKTLRCVNYGSTESDSIECKGFTDIDPSRIKIHRSKRKRNLKLSQAEQLVWDEVERWLQRLNEKDVA